MNNENIFTQLIQSRNKSAFQDKLLAVADRLGFSDFDVSIVDLRNNGEFDFLISSLPTEIHETYTGEQLYKNDLVLEYLIDNVTPIFDAEAYESFNSNPYYSAARLKSSKRSRQILSQFGYYESYTSPFEIGNNTKLLFSVFQKDQKEESFRLHTMKLKTQLDVFSKAICDVISMPDFTKRLTGKPEPKTLTKRNLDVLNALAKTPLTQAEIAELLNISRRSVEHNIYEIKKILEAETNTSMIYEAIKRGLIQVT